MKLSGWGIFNQSFNEKSLLPIVRFVIDHFGKERVLFASDFPVDKIHGSYDMYWDLYFKILRALKIKEKDIHKMVFANAVRVYKLDGIQTKSKL